MNVLVSNFRFAFKLNNKQLKRKLTVTNTRSLRSDLAKTKLKSTTKSGTTGELR